MTKQEWRGGKVIVGCGEAMHFGRDAKRVSLPICASTTNESRWQMHWRR